MARRALGDAAACVGFPTDSHKTHCAHEKLLKRSECLDCLQSERMSDLIDRRKYFFSWHSHNTGNNKSPV